MSTVQTTNIKNAASVSNNIVLDSSGNVGIGTSSPTARLDLSAASYCAAQVNSGSVQGQLAANAGGLSVDVRAVSNHPVTIFANNTERMRITASGNVGIGTSSPGQRLDVQQAATDYQLRIGDAGGNHYDIGRNTTNGLLTFLGNQAAASGYVFSTVNGERARINSNGNFLVGTSSTFDITSGATTQLSGQCAVFSAGSPNTIMSFYNSTQSARVGFIGSNGNSTSYNSGSDYRLKENVVGIASALDAVQGMRPVTFTWKYSPASGVFSGFIAHELQQIWPEAVSGEKDAVCRDGVTPDYQAVDQSKLVPLLVAALQELAAKVAALEAR